MNIATGCLCLVLFFSAINMLKIIQKDDNNFGPYDVSWTQFELCKGPKSKNVTVMSMNVTKEGNYCLGNFNITLLTETKYEEVKIIVYSLKTNSKKILWTYKVSDPCTHFAFAKVIETFFKSRNCVIHKGPYFFSLNLNEINNAFFGSSFFYGDFMLKAILTSKQGNVMCFIIVMKFTKKTEVHIE